MQTYVYSFADQTSWFYSKFAWSGPGQPASDPAQTPARQGRSALLEEWNAVGSMGSWRVSYP